MSPSGRTATRPRTPAPEDSDDAAWIARRMVLDAGAQAAVLRRRASAQTATICEAAEREAETIWQQASVRAAAVREAAERETAELRATVMRLSSAPGELATEKPTAKPGAGPGPGPGPGAEPATGPARRPRRPRPSRQLVAIRVAAVATAALFLFVLIAGTTEVVLHGFAFFVFRSTGTGESGPGALQEDQGPGQPDAPKPTPSHVKEQLKRLRAANTRNG
jgi:hypothetical protein